MDFKSVEKRISDFENGIKKKIHDEVKAKSIRRKTKDAELIIRQLAEENVRNAGRDDGACAYEILKKYRNIYMNPDNSPATGEELELLLYSGIFLKNRFLKGSLFSDLGALIESAVVSVYIGAEDKVAANRELIKEKEKSCEVMRELTFGTWFQ